MLKIEKTAVTGSVALEMLALESIESSNILQSATTLIPNLINELSVSLAGLSDIAKKFNILELKSLLTANFMGTKDIPEDVLTKVFVPVPEGFNGNVLNYQSALADSLKYYETVTAKILKEFYVNVAAFITNKDRKNSIKDDTSKFKDFEATRNGINKEITKLFSKGNSGRTVFHDAYNDYAEFKQAHRVNSDLVKQMDLINLSNVASQVKKIVDTLDIAIKSAERGDYDKASNEALMNIANGTYELAQQVEFLAATVYRIKALTFAIGETDAKIKAL